MPSLKKERMIISPSDPRYDERKFHQSSKAENHWKQTSAFLYVGNARNACIVNFEKGYNMIKIWKQRQEHKSVCNNEPGGSMKSKWTRSSIPSFFNWRTTVPKLDLKISG